jgi:hypothetical protein
MIIGVLPGELTAEFGDALFFIDGVAITLFFMMIYSENITAVSNRVLKRLGYWKLISRIRRWRAKHKSRKLHAPDVNPLPPIAWRE